MSVIELNDVGISSKINVPNLQCCGSTVVGAYGSVPASLSVNAGTSSTLIQSQAISSLTAGVAAPLSVTSSALTITSPTVSVVGGNYATIFTAENIYSNNNGIGPNNPAPLTITSNSLVLACPVTVTGSNFVISSSSIRGQFTMTSGQATLTVSNSQVNATSIILITLHATGGTQAVIYVSSKTAGSFVVSNSGAATTNTSSYDYVVIN